MPRTKLGVNDPCPCKSGKKVKKCHPGHFDKWGDPIPSDDLKRAAEQYHNPTFPHGGFEPIVNHGVLTGRPFIDTDFKGSRMRAVGSRVYKRPLAESFHQFLFNRLWETLVSRWGVDWQTKQVQMPIESRHPFSRWFSKTYEVIKNGMAPSEVPGVSQVKMSGEVKALLAFAYDLYTLEHHGVPVDDALWNRIANPDQFQGARYEIAIAAMACRAGFKVEWCVGKDKHGEFIGTHTASGKKIVFEAKSHARDGALGKTGVFDPSKANIKIMQHINKALKQTEKSGLPVLIFDDLNLPIIDGGTEHQLWFQKINRILENSGFNQSYKTTHYGGLIVTNFAWHFHEDLPEKHNGNDVLSYWHINGKFSIDPGIMRLLGESAKQYGFVPPKLEEMKDLPPEN